MQEAIVVAEEHIALWKRQEMTPEFAWQALCRTRDRNEATWWDVRAYMIRWWLRNRDAA